MRYDFSGIPLVGWAVVAGFYAIFIVLSILITDSRPDIHVRDESISKVTFGKLRKDISWKDISRIEVDSMVRPAAGDRMRFVKLFSKHGTIFFSDRISDFDQLVQLLSRKAQQYSITFEQKEAT